LIASVAVMAATVMVSPKITPNAIQIGCFETFMMTPSCGFVDIVRGNVFLAHLNPTAPGNQSAFAVS
jgi:hypothetical protein